MRYVAGGLEAARPQLVAHDNAVRSSSTGSLRRGYREAGSSGLTQERCLFGLAILVHLGKVILECSPWQNFLDRIMETCRVLVGPVLLNALCFYGKDEIF